MLFSDIGMKFLGLGLSKLMKLTNLSLHLDVYQNFVIKVEFFYLIRVLNLII